MQMLLMIWEVLLKDGMIYDQFNTINNDYSGLKPYTTELTTQPF